MSDYLAAWQGQGPADNCVIGGRQLGWLSCSAYGMGMLEDQITRGHRVRDGCDVRRRTGDTVGGLTMNQVAAVAEADGVDIEVHVGSRVCSPGYAADQLHRRRPFGLQGNTGPLIGTPQMDTGGDVSHWIDVMLGHGWVKKDGHWYPSKGVTVLDSAADGRHSGIAQGPQRWPWERVLAFAAALEPNGPGKGRLGHGKFYAGFGDPVPPIDALKLRKGAVKTTPYPDRQRVDVRVGKLARVMSAPTYHSTVRRRLRKGDLFVAYQYVTDGQLFEGSRKWYGNKAGDEWMPKARVDHEGGST